MHFFNYTIAYFIQTSIECLLTKKHSNDISEQKYMQLFLETLQIALHLRLGNIILYRWN